MKVKRAGVTLTLGAALFAGGCVRVDVSTRPARVELGTNELAAADGPTRVARAKEEAGRVLDAWHDAAARGDFDAYFARMTDDAVFLGTDKTERWVGPEFRAWARPYFDGPTAYGRGAWTYRAIERHVQLSTNGNIAWADEVLWNEKYGHCRGTAVLRRGVDDGRLRIAHYGLAFLIPNEVAADVTARGMAFEAEQRAGIGRAADGVPTSAATPADGTAPSGARPHTGMTIEPLPPAGDGG